MKALVMDAKAVGAVLEWLDNARGLFLVIEQVIMDNEPEGPAMVGACEYLEQTVFDLQRALDRAEELKDWPEMAEGGAGAGTLWSF